MGLHRLKSPLKIQFFAALLGSFPVKISLEKGKNPREYLAPHCGFTALTPNPFPKAKPTLNAHFSLM